MANIWDTFKNFIRDLQRFRLRDPEPSWFASAPPTDPSVMRSKLLDNFSRSLDKAAKNLDDLAGAAKFLAVAYVAKRATAAAISLLDPNYFSYMSRILLQNGRNIDALRARLNEPVDFWDRPGVRWFNLHADERRTGIQFHRGIQQRLEMEQNLESVVRGRRGAIQSESMSATLGLIASRPGMTPGYMAYQQIEAQRLAGPRKFLDDVEQSKAKLQRDIEFYKPFEGKDPDIDKKIRNLEGTLMRFGEQGMLWNIDQAQRTDAQMRQWATNAFYAEAYGRWQPTTGRIEEFGRSTVGIGAPTDDPQLAQLIRIGDILSGITSANIGGIPQAEELR